MQCLDGCSPGVEGGSAPQIKARRVGTTETRRLHDHRRAPIVPPGSTVWNGLLSEGFFRLVKVSVVIPTYNRRELLPRAVASVLSQDPPVHELVIVDDGSSDETCEWALSIGDPRVTVIERPHSGNIAHLRNVGAAASTAGEYLAFLDSDDWWHRDKLAIQMAGAPFGWSFGLVDVDGKGPIGCGNTAPEVVAAELLDSQRVGAPVSTLVVSQELFDQVGGFDENSRIIFREDWHLAVRLALADPYPFVVREPIATVGVQESRSTTQLGESACMNATARAYESLVFSVPAHLRPIAFRRWFWHRTRALKVRIKRRLGV